MSLYFWILLCIIGGPFILSFDKRIAFYKYFRYLIPVLLIVTFFFAAWDKLFTDIGVWGFNEKYISGWRILNLPLEEILFFVAAPFAFLFIYEVIRGYSILKLPVLVIRIFFVLIIIFSLVLIVKNPFGYYTLSAAILAIALSIVILLGKLDRRYLFVSSYLVVLIPFFIINGWLTGSFTSEPVVWYNDQNFSSWRMLTIPLEDFLYNFDLMLIATLAYEKLKFQKGIS